MQGSSSAWQPRTLASVAFMSWASRWFSTSSAWTLLHAILSSIRHPSTTARSSFSWDTWLCRLSTSSQRYNRRRRCVFRKARNVTRVLAAVQVPCAAEWPSLASRPRAGQRRLVPERRWVDKRCCATSRLPKSFYAWVRTTWKTWR